ncbi:PREDICTED: glycine N-acyltransferase-like protein 2, partial [Bison bison bison]|uniref:Glycine N-acyltransferase-like protein n=1 Tax=Bison bison bison TaxID=43346 RepID=A0A6P3GPM4_BISBB
MFVLREPQQLQILYESLEESIPESLKVYGALFHIRNKNPFNLEVLVDAWPEYRTVVIRPQKEWKETFQNIFLDVSHARLVNEHWELGKNEKSLKYVERCLQNFAGF